MEALARQIEDRTRQIEQLEKELAELVSKFRIIAQEVNNGSTSL